MSSQPLKDVAAQLPKTVSAAQAGIGKTADNFKKYACCPSCSEIDRCTVVIGGLAKSMKCPFPDHPQRWQTVRTSSGSTILKI